MKKLPIPLRNQLLLLVISSILIVLGYQLADKPIVFWAEANNFRQYSALIWFTHFSPILVACSFVLYPLLLIRFFYYNRGYHDYMLLAFANSIAITAFLKDFLKQIFGRSWPATWTNYNLSLLHDGSYGFNWLHGNEQYASFPSGHVAIIVAAMTIIWLTYPRLRWLAALLSIGMVIAQVTLYYHFLSDAIAGATLGYLVARNVIFVSEIKVAQLSKSERDFGINAPKELPEIYAAIESTKVSSRKHYQALPSDLRNNFTPLNHQKRWSNFMYTKFSSFDN